MKGENLKVDQFIHCSDCENLIGSSSNPPNMDHNGLCDKCYSEFEKKIEEIRKEIKLRKEAKQTQD